MDKKTFKKYCFVGVFILLIIIFCISITPVSLQNDTFYNIKIGELISQNGIDMQDHFSWHQDLSYTYPHWLYDLITYFVYNLFNFEGIYITTCILSCILGISLYLISSKLSKNYIVPFFTTIGALYLLRGYITARAQLLTFILFIVAIYCIEKFLETKHLRYGIVLVFLSLLIANLHCAVWLFLFVLFLPYIAEYLIAIILDFFIYRKFSLFVLKQRINFLTKSQKDLEKLSKLQSKLDDFKDKNIKIRIRRDKDLENPYKIRLNKNKATLWLIVIMIVCVLMGFLTPIGTTPFTYLPKTMQGNTTENINEHLPMTLSNQTEVIVTLILFLALLIFSKVKIKLSDLIMLGGLTYLMLISRRQLSMFAIICSVILAKLVVEFIDINFKGGIKNFNNFFTDAKTILLIVALSSCLSYSEAKGKFDEKIINEKDYPVEACDYILENIDLENSKFYNEYNYGSYMLFRGIPVFIDSRADLYAPEFSHLSDDIFMDFMDCSNIGKYYGDIFDKYGITHLILYKNAKINMLIEKADKEKYKQLYSDDNFVIYEIVNSESAKK